MKLFVIITLSLVALQVNAFPLQEDTSSGNNWNNNRDYGGQIESINSTYVKLISDTPKDYAAFASECAALGLGWAPAILNSPAELDFIRQGQRTFSDDRSYWLGGSTDTQPWGHIGLSNYNTGNSGANCVIVTTWPYGRTYDLDLFQLKTLVPSYSDSIYSILCEKPNTQIELNLDLLT